LVNNREDAKSISSQDAGDPDDMALVARARDGDARAFRSLVERYERRAYSLAYGMVHNQADALDICQEAFLKVHRHLGGFQGDAAFYTWLYRIVMNLCLDHLRRAGRATQLDYDDAIGHDTEEGGELPGLPQRFEADPGEALRRKELRGQLESAIARLSPTHRAVLLLREVDGLAYEDMAKVMRCSKGTIMSRLFYARRNMQRLLKDTLGDAAPPIEMDGDGIEVEEDQESGVTGTGGTRSR
jgi:RNA polymerase sigma-70 factor (ECF subfamily)